MQATGKELKDVSFVGLHATQYGIIGFADSKATMVYGDEYREDKERGCIKKIFKNDKFICVTHGNNELFENRTKIEDYMNSNLKNYDYKDFFNCLFDKLRTSPPRYNDGKYNFIIGTYDEKGYPYLRKITIDCHQDVVFYDEKKENYSVIYGGDEKYRKIYDNIPKYYDIPYEKYSEMIRKQIENIIDIYDIDIKYNSVGKPVQIEHF